MTCKHDHIQTYRLEDGTPVMWACAACKHKFEPLVLPAAADKAGGDEPVATGTWEHLKLMMEESAWDGKIELADALANIVDFEKYYTRPQPQFDEPVAWAVTYNGAITRNIFETKFNAETCCAALNQTHPRDSRSVIPLFTRPQPQGGKP